MKNMKRSKLDKAMPVRNLAALLLSILVMSFLNCCESKSSDDEINLYCCSAMKDVIVEGIIPAFHEMQLAQNKRDINFVTNFAGSVELTCAMATERTADVAILASEIDAMRLLNRGIINEQTWQKSPHQGTIAQTPILILYNSQEATEITGFQDLAQESVKLIHPCPLYSGLGQWALMASYGSFLFETADDSMAMDKLKDLWRSVTVTPASTLMARDLYTRGRGNAIITYESEILGSSNREVMPGKVSVPANTIICELKVVRIPQEVSPAKDKLVEEFKKFLWSDRAQQIFVDYGFRSVADRLNGNNSKFFELGSTFALDSLGGIPFVKCQLIEIKWQNEIRNYFKKSGSSDADIKC